MIGPTKFMKRWLNMASIEEIFAQIQEKSIEREMAVKRIRSGIKKKREEIKKYINSFYPK